MNQTMANGQVVIYGFQCDGYSGTWDYTINQGTPQVHKAHWIHATAPCDPSKWATDAWHNVEIDYYRDATGNVTYESVSLDGQATALTGASGLSAFDLGWDSTLLTNFQLDGAGASGNMTVYLDNLTITRW